MQASSNAVEKVTDGKSTYEVQVTLQPFDHNQHDRLEKVVTYPDNYDIEVGEPQMIQGALVVPVSISQIDVLSRAEKKVIADAEQAKKDQEEAIKKADAQRAEDAKAQEDKLLDRIADRVAEKMVKTAAPAAPVVTYPKESLPVEDQSPISEPAGRIPVETIEKASGTAEMTKAPAD